MDAQARYTVAQMRQTLDLLRPIFDVVRLVDPNETAVLSLTEDGQLCRKDYSCFRTLNRDCRCDNCTSLHAALNGCQRTKYEFIRDNIFYFVSRPLTLELPQGDLSVVLELVSHVSDQLLLEKDHGQTILERMDELQAKIYQDELTQAFNRRYLNEFSFLHRNIEHVPTKLGLIMLDLRRFKNVNDTLGHKEGDRILALVASTLRSHIRGNDSVIRMGGDEFLVTLIGCDEELVQRKMAELQQALEPIAPADLGYSYADHFDTDPLFLNQLLEEADRRMYANKRKNHV